VRRRPFTFFSALSLLLCVAVGGMWAWSFFLPVVYRFHAHGERCEAVLLGGQVKVSNAPEVVGQAVARRRARAGGAATRPAAGPAFWSQSSKALGPTLIMLLATAPVLSARRRRERQRNRLAGLCPSCGYDLRATPARCPECGVTPSTLL
jgi:hypothetical protein